MKKLVLLAIAAATVASCAEQKPAGYAITGQTNALEGKIYLQVLEGKMPVTIDSTEVVEGKFSFSGEVQSPMMAQIADASGAVRPIIFALENSPIAITFDNTVEPALTVSGSKEDSVFRQYFAAMQTVASQEQFTAAIDSVLAANTSSVAAAYVLFRLYSPMLDAEKMRTLAQATTGDAQNSVYVTKTIEKADLLDQTAVGKKFLDFSAADTLGNMVALSDVAGKGDKWVLLDFWASWCGPCRAENPHVVEAFKQYGKQGFTVFGVSLDRDGDKWKEAIVKDQLNWTNISDLKFWECEAAQMYGVSSIPSNVLIAPDGTIAARNLRGEALTEKLSEVFKK